MTVSLMIARHRDSGGAILELITKLDFACVARIPTVVYSEGWGARPDRSIGNGKSASVRDFSCPCWRISFDRIDVSFRVLAYSGRWKPVGLILGDSAEIEERPNRDPGS